MRNQQLFERTVNILVNAYKNDGLKQGSCYACAVGNIICANMYNNNVNLFAKRGFDNDEGYHMPHWTAVFAADLLYSDDEDDELNDDAIGWQRSAINLKYYYGIIKKEIDSTGYSIEELQEIEFAFESAYSPNADSKELADMLPGLTAVYNVLCDIHEVDMKEVASAELVFVN